MWEAIAAIFRWLLGRRSTDGEALKRVEQAQEARRKVDPSQAAIDADPDNLDRKP